MSITKEQLAQRLTGRKYGNEITREEEAEAKASGLVVIFGYSDDNIELRGWVHDEVGCYCGSSAKKIVVTSEGVLDSWDDHEEKNKLDAERWFDRENLPRATLDVTFGVGEWAWNIVPDVPHATFEIFEGTDKFCRGVVMAEVDFKYPAQ